MNSMSYKFILLIHNAWYSFTLNILKIPCPLSSTCARLKANSEMLYSGSYDHELFLVLHKEAKKPILRCYRDDNENLKYQKHPIPSVWLNSLAKTKIFVVVKANM